MAPETQTTAQHVPLFDMFEPATYEAWRAAAEQTLKGAPFEKRLITKTYEQILLQPIYNAADIADLPHLASLPGFAPFTRDTRVLGPLLERWQVAQELPYPTATEINQAAHADLPRGLTALNLPLDQATLHGLDPDSAAPAQVGAGGLSLATLADARRLLDQLDLSRVALFINAGAQALPVAAILLTAATEQGAALDQVHGCLGADPLGILAASGTLPASLDRCYDLLAEWTRWAIANTPRLRSIIVSTHVYHNSGAHAAQELGCALATGVAYLRAMQARGLSVNEVAPRIQFACSVGSQFFLEVARLRAARMLWARVVAAFAGDEAAQRMHLHVRTSAWTKTRYDVYNNMLRATGEAMAAVMGGAQSIHISHFDEAWGLPDEFSRRIARNLHVILQEECNFFRLIDPPGGSWAVEKLTDEIAARAWAFFQEIERQGGMAAALQAGIPQTAIAATRAERFDAIAHRREVIVGVNMYPNLAEKLPEVRQIDHVQLHAARAVELRHARETRSEEACHAALLELAQQRTMTATLAATRAGATLGELSCALAAADSAAPQVTSLSAYRAAEQFEALRAAADAYTTRAGRRPTVFLANMGPISQHKARADFATGFFTAGGFAVIGNDGFATAAEAAAAALASGAEIVTICSTDETYPDIVPELAQTIKAQRPDTTIVLAGYPTDLIDMYRAAGVDEFIHLRANCYETLARLQRLKGVAE
ncbi:methylmalonyl-CoA mutase family protein [Chloroflexus sp.]|uniref:methylmalonyl-CoA mutase family protein n=1 Tax=Chloroflexus sp. TaxID=1904827 RepID=UPI0026091220|nr:methylmalonyl-CoA mutase family protein [uncultured Chloroflexus sp.]